MPWRALSGQDDEIPIPPHRGGDLSRPFQFAKRWFLAHVIDTSRCAIISGSQRNRCGHVLHVASRRAPGGQRLGKDDVAAPVSDALHYEAVTKFSFRFPTGRGPGFLGRRVAARTSIVGGGDHGEGTKNPTPWSRATAARLCQ